MPRKRILSPSLLGLLVKSTKLIGVLKAVKATSFLVTGGSLFVSLLAYDLFLSPWVSLCLVGMLFVHEMGHIWALRRLGFNTPVPVFLPFLGAAIFMPRMPDRDGEAIVGAAGPLVGALATGLCLVAWYWTRSPILHTAALFGAWINLFNMIPLQPFDGGRIVQAIDDKFRYAGLILLIAFTFWLGEPSMIMLWVLFLGELHRLPRWWRTNLAAGLTLGMGALFVSGQSSQPALVDVMDMGVAGFFTFLYWMLDRQRPADRDRLLATLDQPRPYPTLGQRVGWVVTYIGLLMALLIMMWYLTASA